MCPSWRTAAGLGLPPPTFLRDHSLLFQIRHGLSVLGSFPWEGSRTAGAETPLDNTHLLLGLGLPNPALQALCKLITASETGEQLISRVS